MYKSALAGTGSYLPSRVVANGELEPFLETSDDWIRSRTGIGARRIAAEDETTSDMAALASRRALEAAGVDASEIDLCIVGTFTGDTPLPACASHLAPKIGLRPGVPAFDIAAACAGFLFALDVADRFIRTGGAQRVLVVGAELLSRVVDWSDRTTAVLFGDGAGAAVIERVDESDPRSIGPIRLHTDGTHANAIAIPVGGTREPVTARSIAESRNKMQMVGKDVFKASLGHLGNVTKATLAEAGLAASDIDWFVPHQANIRILESVAESLGVSMDRFVLTLEELGNTSSASIPIALDRGIRDGRIKKGDTTFLFALGAGLSFGAGVLRV